MWRRASLRVSRLSLRVRSRSQPSVLQLPTAYTKPTFPLVAQTLFKPSTRPTRRRSARSLGPRTSCSSRASSDPTANSSRTSTRKSSGRPAGSVLFANCQSALSAFLCLSLLAYAFSTDDYNGSIVKAVGRGATRLAVKDVHHLPPLSPSTLFRIASSDRLDPILVDPDRAQPVLRLPDDARLAICVQRVKASGGGRRGARSPACLDA